MRPLLAFAVGCAIGALVVWGWSAYGGHLRGTGSYAGQQERTVSSLGADDIAQLETGAGWGLARPAELNGYPGPAHVLELADELALDAAQKAKVDAAFQVMNARARDRGAALIEAETALDAIFRAGTATPDMLQERLAATEAVRADLRAIHLSAHLAVTPLLNEQQKRLYAELRGYGADHDSSHSGH